MSMVPKWLDDLIWCGTPVDPAKIEYPKDPPGVLGPNTLRELQRTVAPFNAVNKYTPVRIDFSPADWKEVKQHIEAKSVSVLPSGMPPVLQTGMQLGELMALPRGMALFHYADKRVEFVRFHHPQGPKVSEENRCKCRGVICTCTLGCGS